MRLTDIRTFIAGNPAPGVGGRYFVFVKLTTDGNVHGVGEAYCVPFHPEVVTRMLTDVFERYLAGEDPHHIERMWRRVYSAGYTQHPDLSLMAVLSALEMACWDIIGKEANQPVYNLLGGRVHERLRSYTYIYARPGDRSDVYRDPDLAAERAAEYLAQGFTALKFDPAGPYSAFDGRQLSLAALDLCERFMRQLRAAVGSEADLLFGTHGQMTAAGAPRHQVRFRAPAGRGGGGYPADEPGPCRGDPRGEEDRGAGRGAPCAARAAPVLRAGRGRRQHPARHLQPELPDPRGYRALAGISCRGARQTHPLGGGVRDPADGAGARRRAQRGAHRPPPLPRQAAAPGDGRPATGVGRLQPQFGAQALLVPEVEQLHHVLTRRDRAGLVSGTGRAALRFFDERRVLGVGGVPYAGELLQIVVATLLRVGVHQPGAAYQRASALERQRRERQHVVGKEMEPGVRLGVKVQRSQARIAQIT